MNPEELYPQHSAPILASGFHAAGDLDDLSSPRLVMAAKTNFFSQGGDLDELSLDDRDCVTIGRHSSNDLTAHRTHLSARHAQIVKEGSGYVLTDLGSDLGTYVNGEKISGPVRLNQGDHISMADVNVSFRDGKLVYDKFSTESRSVDFSRRKDSERPVILSANIQDKTVKHHSGSGTKTLIKDIRMDIREGTLVALLGTAGAGKTTVMNCLNGMELVGVRGSVIYRGVDLTKDFERMKYMIGSVPQKKVFHAAFTPEEEFRQSAILRLPGDTTEKEIKARVDKTLEMLSMNGVRKSKNSTLSGGEQTRVNVGIELVADRDLLCLDEPDQGLSPNYKHELFMILQNLAHNYGKTVLSIIHDVSEIDVFDQVIMLAKVDGVGRLAFSGSPAEARKYFGCEIRDAYALLEREPERFVK